MVFRKQTGFSLIEIVIVLAIGSTLAAGFIAGSGALQDRNIQTGRLDELKNQLEKIRQEANSTVSSASNGNSAYQIFGKMVEFDPTDDTTRQQYTVSTILADDNDDRRLMRKCIDRTVNLTAGIRFDGSQRQAIVFGRSPDQVYHPPYDYTSVEDTTIPCDPPPLDRATPEDGVGTPPGPTTPPVDGCGAAGWVCGLYGRYYDGLGQSLIGKTQKSAFVDQQIGVNMGNGGSSWNLFTNTLRYRTDKPAAVGVSVGWTGQIFIGNDGPRKLCFGADDGSEVYISSTGVNASGGPVPLSNSNPRGYITASYGELTGGADPCATVESSRESGWFDIRIEYQQMDPVESTPFARLYEDRGGVTTEVPSSRLRTPSTNRNIWPDRAYTDGLRGEYFYDDTFNPAKRVSVHTDKVIGLGFSWVDSGPNNIFASVLRERTTENPADDVSVRWSGQVKADYAGNHTYCIPAADNARLFLNGTRVASTTIPYTQGSYQPSSCATSNVAEGWNNITIEYEKDCCRGVDDGAGIRLSTRTLATSDGVEVDVPATHLRRSMDYTWQGDRGECIGTGFTCTANSDGSKSLSDGGTIKYTATGLNPGTYKLDISYFNDSNLIVPPWSSTSFSLDYRYQLFVRVNGTQLSSANPASLDIWDPGRNVHTKTITGVTVPQSGNLELELYWPNDMFFLGWYDTNFAVDQIDLHRDINSNGDLAWQYKFMEGTNSKTDTRLAQTLFKLTGAKAAFAAQDANVFNPQNYERDKATGAFTFHDNNQGGIDSDGMHYDFEMDGVSGTSTIIVDPTTNGISRRIEGL